MWLWGRARRGRPHQTHWLTTVVGVSYPVQGIVAFGRELLRTLDLDPVYVMLHLARLDQQRLRRWLLAYCCFYHSGVSCWIADHKKFWEALAEAAANENRRYPRGTERRHFRGRLALKAVKDLSERYKEPEGFLDHISASHQRSRDPIDFKVVFERAQEPVGFGPWIAFKVADMVDRCGIRPVRFEGSEPFMFKDPAMGLKFYQERYGLTHLSTTDTMARLISEFKGWDAPPGFDRPVNVQECETVLCKWKSHLNGRYPVGKDTREILHHLEGWGPLADKMKRELKVVCYG